MTLPKPAVRPARPYFSSGPCAKRPGYALGALEGALLGRSHRSAEGRARLKLAIDKTRALLGIPADYRLGIVPASDTGAMEMAMWSLLGARGVDVLAFESFGEGWAADAQELGLSDLRILRAPYGALPDLSQTDGGRDIVFTWNGTTSGVRVPDGQWIKPDRGGLTICDATSAVFAQALPWDKLDVATFSWQKALGGEAQHGMLVLSPRAVARLESFKPPRPLPKLFRLTRKGKLIEGIFSGETINTPSMLCVEDWLDALSWAERLGGLSVLIARADENLAAIARWVKQSEWADFLCTDERLRSNTSVCLTITDPTFLALAPEGRQAFARKIAGLLAEEKVAYDIASYRDAPPGLRLWAGATVERADLEALFPWLDWAFAETRAAQAKAA